MGHLKVLFKYDWELVKCPAGAQPRLAMDAAEVYGCEDFREKIRRHFVE